MRKAWSVAKETAEVLLDTTTWTTGRIIRGGALAIGALALCGLAVATQLWSRAEQATATGSAQMSLTVKTKDKSELVCDVGSLHRKCTIDAGAAFSVDVLASQPPPSGYTAFQIVLQYSASLALQQQPGLAESRAPTCDFGTKEYIVPTDGQPGRFILACKVGPPAISYGGVLANVQFVCPAQGGSAQIDIVAGEGPKVSAFVLPGIKTSMIYLKSQAKGAKLVADAVLINCVAATPTPTPTPGIPRMQKLPPLQNVFLTRQGTKIPPGRCLDSRDVAVLTESLSVPIGLLDPKDPSQQQLGGFSFQVTYDPLKVCVVLRVGQVWTVSPQQLCAIEDAVTKPTLQGVARIACVTVGKVPPVDTSTVEGRLLAVIEVRAQPGVYSQTRASQGNGQVAQLNNEACSLVDLQGHPVEVFSCEGADVTFRYLEGDVEPDCQVNTLDSQTIAFRWNTRVGQLNYEERFDLEPSGPLADHVIGIADLQFVEARFGSTCANPWPAQPPVNPKR